MTDSAALAQEPAVREPVAKFDDSRVQTVYEVLCDTDDRPPKGSNQHWEGWVAQRIVDKLFPQPATNELPYWRSQDRSDHE